MPVPAEANPQAGTERSLPLPSAPSPLGRRIYKTDEHFLMRSYLFKSTLICLKSVYFTHVLLIASIAQGHELFRKNHAAAVYRAKDFRE